MDDAVQMRQSVSDMRKKQKRRRSRKAYAAGVLVVILALVGALTIIVGIVRAGADIVTNRREKESWERFVLPVVMMNLQAFDNPSEIDNKYIQMTSLWATLLNNSLEKFDTNDFGFLIIRASEVDIQCARLFGKDITIQHGEIDFLEFGDGYIYEPEHNVYIVNVAAITQVYTATVEEIEKVDAEILLTVGYIPPGSMWEMSLDGSTYQPDPVKYMEYVIRRDEGGTYYIGALRQLSSGAAGTADSSVYNDDSYNSGDNIDEENIAPDELDPTQNIG